MLRYFVVSLLFSPRKIVGALIFDISDDKLRKKQILTEEPILKAELF